MELSQQAKAVRVRWSKVSSEDRSKMMRALALRKHQLTTPEQKHKHAMKMLRGKKRKKKDD